MTGQQALLVIAAVFWAAVTPSIGRYNPSNTAGLFVDDEAFKARSRRRLVLATVIVNALPLLVLGVTWHLMPDHTGVRGIVSGAIAGLFPVGLPRLLHAALASDERWQRFYTEDEWKLVMCRWDPISTNDPPAGYNDARSHALPGLFYLLGAPALGLLIASPRIFA